MAPFAPNLTHRVKIGYRGAGKQHSITIRKLRGMSQADAILTAHDAAHDIFASFNASRLAVDFAFLSSEYCAPDSVDFIPSGALPTGVTGTCALNLFTPLATVASVSAFGRGAGSFTSMKLYGCLWNPMNPANPEANGVIGAGESTEIEDLIAVLNLAEIHCPNNTLAVFVQEVTYDINDGWQKLVRR